MTKGIKEKVAEELYAFRLGMATSDLIFGIRLLRKIGNTEKSF
jgi:hypothetical protein